VTDRIFAHSTPALCDRYMGPLLFEPYAKLVAERCAPMSAHLVTARTSVAT
jgi:hypothetical protein